MSLIKDVEPKPQKHIQVISKNSEIGAMYLGFLSTQDHYVVELTNAYPTKEKPIKTDLAILVCEHVRQEELVAIETLEEQDVRSLIHGVFISSKRGLREELIPAFKAGAFDVGTTIYDKVLLLKEVSETFQRIESQKLGPDYQTK